MLSRCALLALCLLGAAEGSRLRMRQDPDTACGKGFDSLVPGTQDYFATASVELFKHPGKLTDNATFATELQCWFAHMVTQSCGGLPSQAAERKKKLTEACTAIPTDWQVIWKMFSTEEVAYFKKEYPAKDSVEEGGLEAATKVNAYKQSGESPIAYKQAMETVKQILIDDLMRQLHRQTQLMAFVEKILCVLLAEAFSSTVYEILSVIIAPNSALTNVQQLIARSIYAVLISIYNPIVGWLLARSAASRQSTFLGIAAHSHAALCPVLLAWGWKDWASQLDVVAGPAVWDELVVALVLTFLVVSAQVMPCFKRAKAAVAAAGGESDTLCARFAVLPGCFMLTLGYVWNEVISWIVGKVQGLEPTPSYHFLFTIQFAYAVLACIIITVVSVYITKTVEVWKKSFTDVEKAVMHPREVSVVHNLKDWAGLEGAYVVEIVPAILAFVYGWAVLDTADDFGFGVMFSCSSYSACSYQSNFVYAVVCSAGFAIGAMVLHSFKHFEHESALMCKAVALQINAMILTVGWAWMNFYSTIMSDATSKSPFNSAGQKISIYVVSTIVIWLVHAVFQFILQRTNQGLQAKLKKSMEALEKLQDKA